MWIDFKKTKRAKVPLYDNELSKATYKLKQNSTYQYSIWIEKDRDIGFAKRYLRRHHYEVLYVYPEEMARSSDYRTTFFKSHKKPKGGYYRCIYCHKKLKGKIEIDHIYPVHKAKTKEGQFFLKLLGIKSVNDPKNLAASCHRCNRAKSSKTGLWLIRALLGSHEWYWVSLRIIEVALLIGSGIIIAYGLGYL